MTFWDWANKIGTPLGAIATAVAALFAFYQIRAANTTLYSTNSYKVQTDLITAYSQILEAQSSSTPDLLRRRALFFDALVESINALYNNDGISNESWVFVLRKTCGALAGNKFRIGDVDLMSTRDACEQNAKLWKDQPR
jgi:hypothetical protein